MMKRRTIVILFWLLLFLLTGCTRGGVVHPEDITKRENSESNTPSPVLSPVEKILPEKRTAHDMVVLGARREAARGVTYDASYLQISYPGGDVPSDRGVCTDVVIRAFRNAEIDLQQLIHEDMLEHFSLYPHNWGLKGTDANIDHRRVPNQMKFFARQGKTMTLSTAENDLSQWQWGDVVYWKFSNGLEHCGVVSDLKNEQGLPLVIHNAGIALEEDCLERWEIIGHYRYP
jgi:uncharacterized protein YijF (DUF1287 family)